MMEWTQEQTLELIELYRTREVLWDARHPTYYNKIRKNDAWVEVATQMKTTVDQCKKKITGLLAALRREKAKIKKTRGTGTGKYISMKPIYLEGVSKTWDIA